MQIKDHVQVFGTAPGDHPLKELETFRVIAIKQAVMQRNSNGVEPGPMQERDVLMRDVVLAVLLPECGRTIRSKQLQHQRANLTRRLRPALKQPHVTFRHQPIAQICCAKKERFAGGIDDLFVIGVCELGARLRSQRQKKKRQPQKSELEHGSLLRKAYTKLAMSQSVAPIHVKPLKAATRLFREPPNAERNRQPDEHDGHEQPRSRL